MLHATRKTAFFCSRVIGDFFRQGRVYAVAGTRFLNYNPSTTFISLVALAKVHPSYNITPYANDIAVFRVMLFTIFDRSKF